MFCKVVMTLPAQISMLCFVVTSSSTKWGAIKAIEDDHHYKSSQQCVGDPRNQKYCTAEGWSWRSVLRIRPSQFTPSIKGVRG
jgi:hypothetical protein